MPHAFDAVDLIHAKRGGESLTPEQIAWVLAAFTRGEVGDEQMAALAMAVWFRGLDRAELSAWTAAMIDSGVRLDLGGIGRPTVDKHSTGGVGDKVSLPLAPLVASFGVAVPMLSGRGLGHTGGTLDKLEAIAGFSPDVPAARMREILADSGALIAAAGADLAPADKALYALRDVTGTVDSIPLIASSIMSKKIAEGTAALVLDVKVGAGAFMREHSAAHELAETMVALGEDAGVATRALLTDMSMPLGRAVGNALEVAEALEVLAGGGPADVVELTCALAREMLDLAGVRDADAPAALAKGRAMDAWRTMIRAQGGDPDAPLPVARHTHDVCASVDGVHTGLDALAVGTISHRLGAGRTRKEDPVQAAAGVVARVVPGERVRAGQPLLTLHTDTPERIERAAAVLDERPGALRVDPEAADGTGARDSVVLDRVG